MWPDLIQKSKVGGLDVIETYVFWNLHEPVRGQVCFLLTCHCDFFFFFFLFLHSDSVCLPGNKEKVK